jgi:nitrite reductase/ring-hydroxylating ferredoxin subunit
MDNGKELFLYNRSILDTSSYQEMLEIETKWIVEVFDSIQTKEKSIKSRKEFQEAFDNLLFEERNAPSDDNDYISERMSLDEFQVIIQEFAVDGLTEAQSFLPIIPRLPITAQMPFLRVMIDEFGCGNLQQAHSKLYYELLSELEMPTNIENYLDVLNPESYAFLNIFYWLTNRAPDVEYFLGTLAYLESMFPFACKFLADACQRLNIVNSKYYTEHIHIDNFHAKDALRVLWEVDSAVGLDYTKVWTGVQIGSFITAQAFDAALKKAKKKVGGTVRNINKGYNSTSELSYVSSDYTSERGITVKFQGNKYLTPVACPHRGGKLYCGLINEKNGTITCPLHFSKFEITSGKLLSGPASTSLEITEIAQGER